MISFAILGLPRSGTTWAANWLTSDGVVCHHDPIAYIGPDEMYRLDGGIACTGLWMRPDLVAQLDCPIVCLERDPDEVNASLEAINLTPMAPKWFDLYRDTPGHRFNYKALFDERAAEIWHILRGDGFDAKRHAELVKMNIQPQYKRCVPDASIMMEFLNV
jgi:hypothetical protein